MPILFWSDLVQWFLCCIVSLAVLAAMFLFHKFIIFCHRIEEADSRIKRMREVDDVYVDAANNERRQSSQKYLN